MDLKKTEAPVGSLASVVREMATLNKTGIERVRAVLSLRMNQYSDIVLTAEDVQRIARSFMDIEVGSATNLVMICAKARCLYKTRCALYVVDKCPEGLECLHENKILTQALNEYLVSLKIEEDNYAEMVLVNQLTEYELLEYRCNAILSNDHTDMQMEQVVGVDKETGEPIIALTTSHALAIKDSLFKKKLIILQELTATRREKYKKAAALKETHDSSTKTLSNWKDILEKKKAEEVSVEEVKIKSNALQDEDIEND